MSKKGNCFMALCLVAALIGLGFSPAGAAPTNITACATNGAGSYLVGNNISSSGINCLIFTAGPVTLDLNGFTVSGSGGTNGVLASGISNVTVRNGTFSGFARAVYATGTGAVINGVRAVSGSANGFQVGDNATVESCVINGHSGGITAGKNANIVGNSLSGNAGNMIIVSDGSTVTGNTVTLNTGSGGSAIQITLNSRIADNVISTSTYGINASGSHNVMSANTISGCVEGIIAGSNTIISGNNVSNNSDTGIQAGTDCLISGNNVSGNTGVGITSDVRTQFLNNVANGNGNFGIHVNADGAATGNVTDSNTSSGLEVACPSKIAENNALGNGVPNLNETGTGCLNIDNLAP